MMEHFVPFNDGDPVRLNLQILRDELAPLEFSSHLAPGAATRTCTYALPFVPGEPLEEGPVYVAEASELSARPNASGIASVICVGQPTASWRHGDLDILWTEEGAIDVRALLARVARSFARHEEWERSMRGQIEEAGQPRELELVLEGLLAHQLLDERRIEAGAGLLGWDVFDRYLCVSIASVQRGQSQERLESTARSLSGRIGELACVMHGEHLVVICNLTRAGTDEGGMLRSLAGVFIPGLLAVGASEAYGDLKNTFYYYNQALAAARLGIRRDPASPCWRYADYLLADMMRRVRVRQIPAALTPPGLLRLMEHDRANGTDLTRLLRGYLDRDRNVTRTARDLFLTRSTCIRHLEQIGEVSGLDLDDADVRLACSIALRLHERG